MIYPSQVQSSTSDIWKGLINASGVGQYAPFLAAKTQVSTLDFANTLAQTSSEKTVTFTGAKVGDLVQVTATTNTANITYTGYVSAADTVKVRLNNYSASAVDPASQDFTIRLIP